MSNIYKQHDAAFSSVSAFVILNKSGERVATIAFKFPRDGASRLWCYVQWMGLEMVRGFAAGGGYDKKSAAAASAASRLPKPDADATYADGSRVYNADQVASHAAFVDALGDDNGHHWDGRLRNAGFIVLQAV